VRSGGMLLARARARRTRTRRTRARHTRARSARRAAGLLSTEQQRELDGLLELLKCPVRQRILFALAANDAGATDGSGAVRVGG